MNRWNWTLYDVIRICELMASPDYVDLREQERFSPVIARIKRRYVALRRIHDCDRTAARLAKLEICCGLLRIPVPNAPNHLIQQKTIIEELVA